MVEVVRFRWTWYYRYGATNFELELVGGGGVADSIPLEVVAPQ